MGGSGKAWIPCRSKLELSGIAYCSRRALKLALFATAAITVASECGATSLLRRSFSALN